MDADYAAAICWMRFCGYTWPKKTEVAAAAAGPDQVDSCWMRRSVNLFVEICVDLLGRKAEDAAAAGWEICQPSMCRSLLLSYCAFSCENYLVLWASHFGLPLCCGSAFIHCGCNFLILLGDLGEIVGELPFLLVYSLFPLHCTRMLYFKIAS